MNFEIERYRSDVTKVFSKKNENNNLIFVKKLNQFGKYRFYPDCEKGINLLSNFFKISNKNVFLGFGSDNILKNLFLTLDYNSIQILEYSYEMAFYYNKFLCKKIIINPISFNKGFNIKNIELLGGDILYLVSPHSPTGISFNIETILNLSKKFKYVIVDEAYLNPLTFNYPIAENVIFLRTFSKLGGVPGLRLGYAISSEGIINKLNCLRDSYEITINSIEYLEFIIKNKNLIYDNIEELEKCYNLLKTKTNCFSIFSGNFATFNVDNLNGKKYKIDGNDFTRVTLSDTLNYENLYCR
jgi:histidinol-phosphate/aromatic aminotransferase/cobyric acid decarboxylase-like protein